MLYLKLGKVEDAESVVALSRDLFEASIYSTVSLFDPEKVKENYLLSLDKPDTEHCTILLCEDKRTIGFLSCASTSMLYSSDLMALEVGMWVGPVEFKKPGYRKLLEGYYYWAKKIGCKAALVGKLVKDKHSVEVYRMKNLWPQG